MKPVISPELQRWGLRALALLLGGLSALLLKQQPITLEAVMSTVVAALGGATFGNTTLGPGHVDVQTLPAELQESVRPPKP